MKTWNRFTLLAILMAVLLAATLSDVSVEAAPRRRTRRRRTRRHIHSPNWPLLVPPPPPRPVTFPPPPKVSSPPPPPKSPAPPPPAPMADLKLGFYSKTACSNVEDVVRAEVKKEFDRNPGIVALLLRIYFHDCFADGQCDASLLIKENKNAALATELDAGSNQGIRGLAFIDALKKAVVAACVGNQDLVSCADIIALATRDAVSLASSRPRFAIKTGRFDGKLSLRTSGNTLPGSRQSIASIVTAFKAKGFSAEETVVLSGAHSVGQAQCGFFNDRLYDWRGTGKPDPTLDAATAAQLRQTCPNTGSGSGNRVFLDQGAGSAFVLDKSYFVMLTQQRGVLESDQRLLTDPLTRAFVAPLAAGSNANFAAQLENALVKLGNLGVLGSAKGDIRKVCSALN